MSLFKWRLKVMAQFKIKLSLRAERKKISFFLTRHRALFCCSFRMLMRHWKPRNHSVLLMPMLHSSLRMSRSIVIRRETTSRDKVEHRSREWKDLGTCVRLSIFHRWALPGIPFAFYARMWGENFYVRIMMFVLITLSSHRKKNCPPTI